MPQSGNVPPAESSRPAHPVSVKLMSMRSNETYLKFIFVFKNTSTVKMMS